MKRSKIRILYIGDSSRDTKLIKKELMNGNATAYEWKTEASPSAALKSMRGRRPNVILLDLGVQKSQGLDAYFEVRARASKVPLIVITNPDEESTGILALREGAQDYLVKGEFNRQLLSRSIRYAIERGKMQSALDRRNRELLKSENRLKKIVQENAEGIIVMNRDGIVLFANPATEAILGKKTEGILGKRLNLPLAFGERKEIDIPLGQDYNRTAEIRVREIEWDGEDALLVSLHDISERKVIERDLQESQRFSKSIIDTATDAFVMMDSCGLILEWNRKAEEMFGWTRDEALYRSLIETIFPKQHQDYHLQSITDFLSSKEGPFVTSEIELIAIHRDGHEFAVEFNFWPTEVGESYCLSAFIRDISEIKKLQKMKDEFMRTVSHEMRTPLTTIREGISQIHEGLLGETTEEQRDYFGMILDDIDRLTRIINDLLDASRLETGRVDLNVDQVDMQKLIGGIRAVFQPKAEEKGLEIEVQVPEETLLIDADRDKIIQVLTNLVGNAIKFTQEGRVLISLLEEGDTIECCVSDTGQGISEEDVPKIFDKFKQFGSGNGSLEKGTGLGLYIAKAIVELHFGRIWVKSHPEKGTEFYFTLPKHRRDPATPEPIAGKS